MNACLRLLLASLAALTAGLAAAQPVGRVLLAAGDAVAVRNGQTVRLQYNSPIEFRDVLRTGPASSLQVRFVDEGLISLRDNSEFAIEDYRFASGSQGAEEERAFFRLIKGGFRSVTGLIGRARNQNYRVQTQTATIGIRGTDYGVRLCAGDCGSGVKDGLYGTVHGQSSGTNQITVTNEGTPTPQTFGINQHFYVQDSKSPPQPLLQPPTFVSIRPQGKAQAAQQGGQGSGGEQSSSNSGAAAESRPNSPTEAGATSIPTLPVTQYQVTENLNTAGTPAVLQPANGFGVFYPIGTGFEGAFDDSDSTATYNGQNQLLSYQTNSGGPNGSVAGGTIADAGGFTSATGQTFNWGRWTGGTVTTSSGTVLTNVPVLFITGSDVQNGPEAKFIGGQGTYTFRGGPSAVDAGGNLGTITSANLSINFTTQSVSYSIGMNFASIGTFGPAVFSASGTGGPTSGSHNGEFSGSLSYTCSGGGCGTGSTGQFDVGLAGPNGYDFAAVGGGLFNATKAGGVVFITAHEVASFVPGPAPQFLTGQVAFANTSPFIAGATTSLSTNSTTFNTLNQPTQFSNPFGTSGSLNSGTIVETGGLTLPDGTGMNWGRWTGSTVVVTQSSTSVTNPATGLPFVVGSANTTMPTSGTFTYTFAGGPNPTSVAGTSGTWGGGSFVVTFGPTSGVFVVGTPLSMSVGGVNYSFSSCTSGCTLAAGNVTLGNGSPVFLGGTCSGGSCATLSSASAGIGGIFTGSQAHGLAVAGNTSSPAPTVSFAGAFTRP